MIEYIEQIKPGMLLKNLGPGGFDIWDRELSSLISTNKKIQCNDVFFVIQIINNENSFANRIKIQIIHGKEVGWIFCYSYFSNSSHLMAAFEEV